MENKTPFMLEMFNTTRCDLVERGVPVVISRHPRYAWCAVVLDEIVTLPARKWNSLDEKVDAAINEYRRLIIKQFRNLAGKMFSPIELDTECTLITGSRSFLERKDYLNGEPSHFHYVNRDLDQPVHFDLWFDVIETEAQEDDLIIVTRAEVT